jgi:hypothetical protein
MTSATGCGSHPEDAPTLTMELGSPVSNVLLLSQCFGCLFCSWWLDETIFKEGAFCSQNDSAKYCEEKRTALLIPVPPEEKSQLMHAHHRCVLTTHAHAVHVARSCNTCRCRLRPWCAQGRCAQYYESELIATFYPNRFSRDRQRQTNSNITVGISLKMYSCT